MNTDFLGLILTDESETAMTFLEWRSIINGADGNSNMQLIDGAISRLNTAIGGKADGFSFSADTGVLQLTSGGKVIDGASVTINSEDLFSYEMRDKYLSLPVSKVSTSGFITDTTYDRYTTQGIFQMSSQVGERETLIVFNPDIEYGYLMQIRIAYDGIKFRGIHSDEAGIYNSEDWSQWTDMTAPALQEGNYSLTLGDGSDELAVIVGNAVGTVTGPDVAEFTSTGRYVYESWESGNRKAQIRRAIFSGEDMPIEYRLSVADAEGNDNWGEWIDLKESAKTDILSNLCKLSFKSAEELINYGFSQGDVFYFQAVGELVADIGNPYCRGCVNYNGTIYVSAICGNPLYYYVIDKTTGEMSIVDFSPKTTDISVDAGLSAESENPVQNKVITEALNGIQSIIDANNQAAGGVSSISYLQEFGFKENQLYYYKSYGVTGSGDCYARYYKINPVSNVYFEYLQVFNLSEHTTWSVDLTNGTATETVHLQAPNIKLNDESGYYDSTNVEDALAEISESGAKITLNADQLYALDKMFEIAAYSSDEAQSAYSDFITAFGIDQYRVMKKLGADDIEPCGVSYYNDVTGKIDGWEQYNDVPYTYVFTSSTLSRSCYPYFDLPAEGGYAYKIYFNAKTADTKMCIEFYNQNVLDAVAAGEDYSTNDKKDGYGWQTSMGYEWTPPTEVNGSPIKCMRLIFDKAEPNISKLIIYRKKVI